MRPTTRTRTCPVCETEDAITALVSYERPSGDGWHEPRDPGGFIAEDVTATCGCVLTDAQVEDLQRAFEADADREACDAEDAAAEARYDDWKNGDRADFYWQ